jgi:type II secretory pathway component PulF
MRADRDLAVFYRTLAEMMRAGVLGSAALEASAHTLPEAAAAARIVARGQPMSEAFAKFPRVFPADQVRLLQIAEQTGSVDATLADLADYAAEMITARRTVVSGLMLPAFIVHVAAFIVPLPGLILGGLGIGGYFMAVITPLLGLWGVVAAIVLFVQRAPSAVLDAILQRVPVLGEAWRELQLWRMASALRMLARTSLDVPASLRFAASVCCDARVSAALGRAADTTELHGTPASTSLKSSGVLPTDVIALWRNAEVTGSFDSTFTRLAARFAENFRARAQVIAAWLPRIAYFLVILGLVRQIFKLAGSYLGHLGGV